MEPEQSIASELPQDTSRKCRSGTRNDIAPSHPNPCKCHIMIVCTLP